MKENAIYELLAVIAAGAIVCSIPFVLTWKFSEVQDDLSTTAIIVAIGSSWYKFSLISSSSISIHMLVDYIGHFLFTKVRFWSFRDFGSNMIILIAFFLLPNLALLCYVIPYLDTMVFHGVQMYRFNIMIFSTLALLNYCGDHIWSKFIVMKISLSLTAGSILCFYSFFFTGKSFLVLRILSFFCYAIGTIIFSISFYRWIKHIISTLKLHNRINIDEYCCNIYLFSFLFTVLGISLLTFSSGVPNWYNYNLNYLVTETMFFSTFYVIIAVFQRGAIIGEMAVKNVSIVFFCI